MDYEPKPDEGKETWRRRWNHPSILGSFELAKSVLDRHDLAEGLTHVIHHFGDHTPQTRIVVFDYDDAIIDGELNDVVRGHIDFWNTYTTFSGSRTGLHVVLQVRNCPAFRNQLVVPVDGKCKVDILCCNPVAMTGEVFEDFREMATIEWAELDRFPLFTYKEPTGEYEVPEWWTEDPVETIPDNLQYLIPQMEMTPAIEGQGGSKVLFAAACEILRHGVEGREAEALLRCVPAIPEFPPEQIQRTLECAFTHVKADGEFGVNKGLGSEFPDLPEEKPTGDIDEDRLKKYGFRFYSLAELNELDLNYDFAVEGAFVGEGALFVGGREKAFKTGISLDLLFSLATQTPFLNHFEVPRPWRCLMFTAEVGLIRAQQLSRALARERGIDIRTVDNFDISDTVPKFDFSRNTGKFTNPEVIAKLKRYIREFKPEAAMIDPLYFAIGAASVGDMYEIGKVLRDIADMLKDWGVWPMFCHHSKKDSNSEYEPMELNDFYGSGIGAHARQWLLMAHVEPFDFTHGVARLCANIGGSTQGHRGKYNVTIDEGIPDQLSARGWRVSTEVRPEENTKTGPKRDRFLAALASGEAMGVKEVALRANMADGDVKSLVSAMMAEEDPIIDVRANKITLISSEF